MDRKIYQKLLVWKEKNSKMPYMLVGARQTGKTYILTNFCKNEFKNYLYLNLLSYYSYKSYNSYNDCHVVLLFLTISIKSGWEAINFLKLSNFVILNYIKKDIHNAYLFLYFKVITTI